MSDFEQWVLNGRALNDATFTLEQLSAPVPAKIAEWIRGADSEGAILARVPKHENRVIEMTLRVIKQASMDAALGKLALIIDELQECAMHENGTALVWTPANASTVGPITFRCLMGEIVDLPIDWQDSGWLVYTPLIRIRLTCLPFGHGAEVSKGSVTSSDPLITLEVTGVAGDVPALGRLVVTDAASQSRRWLVWGLESRWYPTSSPPSLIVDSASMVTTGFAGVTTTRSGAYSGASNNVIRATLDTQVQAICGLGNLTHVGQFRPQLRFHASATTMAVRLTCQSLDGPFRVLASRVPVVAGWNHVDLGLITVPPTTLGTQRWTGRIEAYSTTAGGETLDIDAAWIIPAELFGRARSGYANDAGVLGAYDDFTAITSGVVLNARTAPLGGSWTTSGATTDFAAADGPGSSEESVSRATLSDSLPGRVAVVGSATYTNCDARVWFYVPGTAAAISGGPVVRYTDNNNMLRGMLDSTGATATDYNLTVQVIKAGLYSVLVTKPITKLHAGWHQLRLVAYASGLVHFSVLTAAGVTEYVTAASADLASGGALASGKVGISDHSANFGVATRYYRRFTVATPPAEPTVCHANQSIEVRHDSALREDATGTYAGAPPEYVGSRFAVPYAGGPARKARVAVMTKRHDVVVTADDFIADSTTAEVFVTPRYLAIPR